MPCTPSSTSRRSHILEELDLAVDVARRARAAAAVRDRRERPQRPSPGPQRGGRWLRSRRGVGRRLAPRPAQPRSPARRPATTSTIRGPSVLPKALRQAWVLDGGWSAYRQRRHGRSPAGLPSDRFVVFTQNHDQVGNRAAGERSSALMSRERLEVAAALLLTSPFVPLLFQGEEWAASTPFQYFTDHPDPELGARGERGPSRGVRGVRLGSRRGARSRRIRPPSSGRGSTGTSSTTSPTRRCSPGTGG